MCCALVSEQLCFVSLLLDTCTGLHLFYVYSVEKGSSITHVENSPQDVICLPPSMLDEAEIIQFVQGTYESRLHFQPPLLFVFFVFVRLFNWRFPLSSALLGWRLSLTIGLLLQMRPLPLQRNLERFKPIIHIDHPPALRVPYKQDTGVGELPDFGNLVVSCRLRYIGMQSVIMRP